MKKLRAVIIGCGAMGSAHGRALAGLAGATVGATVDTNAERAQALAKEIGAEESGTEWRAYLERRDVDIAVVTTYPSTHAEIAAAYLAAGKHVFCEKPLAGTLADCDRILEATRSSGRKLAVGYILRHNASYRKLAQMIHDGAIGRPMALRMLGGEHPVTEEHWRRDVVLAEETSALIDCGCHYVDVMRWFTGAEVVRVSGAGVKLTEELSPGKLHYEIALCTLSDRSAGVYEVQWARNSPSFSVKEFVGPKGRLTLTYACLRTRHQEEGDLIEYYRYPGKYEIINVPGELKPLGAQMQSFLDMIREDRDPMGALLAARESLRIVLAAERAIQTGEAVDLRDYP